MNLRKSTAGIVGLVLFIVAGCSSKNVATVKGRVTLDNKPVAGASVGFRPVDGSRPSAAVTDANGNYELGLSSDQKGAKIGKHKVVITSGQKEDAKGNEITTHHIPPRYNTSTELVREVTAGENTINFDLKSGGRTGKKQPDPNDCQ